MDIINGLKLHAIIFGTDLVVVVVVGPAAAANVPFDEISLDRGCQSLSGHLPQQDSSYVHEEEKGVVVAQRSGGKSLRKTHKDVVEIQYNHHHWHSDT